MSSKKLSQVGVVMHSKGLKGEIKAAFDPEFMAYMTHQPLPHIYIAEKMAKVPYFVQQLSQPDGKQIYTLQLEDVTNKEQAERLSRKEIYFETAVLERFWEEHPELLPEDDSWDFLMGYTLVDGDDQTIGTITNLYSVGASELAAVAYQGREILVPLHESLVLLLDEEAQILVMELPEGILEL